MDGVKSNYMFLNYIYYRVARIYIKDDGIDAFRAIMVISMMEWGLLLNIYLLILHFTDLKEKLGIPTKQTTIFAIVIFFALMALNKFIFKRKYYRLDDLWRTEPKKLRRRKGWLVALALFSPVIIGTIIELTFQKY